MHDPNVTIEAKVIKSTAQKFRGLMFQDKIKPLFLQTRCGIHTFFVKHPIDLVILDDKMRVIKTKRRLKPFRVFVWNPKYRNVLELPDGWIYNNNISSGSKIRVLSK
ncbi:DUF192 domain-containing protein [Patescibacteria group bacterium]